MMTLTSLEEQVLEKLLAGKSDWLAILRDQMHAARVQDRELTGVGFFTEFSVPEDIPRLPHTPSFRFGDVSATIPGLQHGAGFLLHVKDGCIHELEGYSYEEPWPTDMGLFQVHYSNGDERNEADLTNGIDYEASSSTL